MMHSVDIAIATLSRTCQDVPTSPQEGSNSLLNVISTRRQQQFVERAITQESIHYSCNSVFVYVEWAVNSHIAFSTLPLSGTNEIP